MLAGTFVNSATNILVGSVTTKLFDSIVTTKIVQKQEKNRWLREKKLNLFSQLSEEILSIDCKNLINKQKTINNITSKIVLLIEDKELKTNLKNYSFLLNEYECYKSDINLQEINSELIQILSNYMKKM